MLFAGTARLTPLFGVSHEPLERAAAAENVRVHRSRIPFSIAEPLWQRLRWTRPDERIRGLRAFHATRPLLPPMDAARGVVTVHDLAPFTHPEWTPEAFARSFRDAARLAAQRADVIVAVSEFTAGQVRETLRAPDADIRVAPLGVGAPFCAPGDDVDPVSDQELRLAHLPPGAPRGHPYVLSVATSHPRKNLLRLLAAFADARGRAALPHALVLTGPRGYAQADVNAEIERLGLSSVVTRPGFVTDETLSALYRGADALAFPSLHEGCGLPVLEAMACGCPVLTSNTSALPETAGDAALLIDPESVEAISDGLERILTDAALSTRLRAAGLARAAQRSVEAVARAYLSAYRASD